jgi:sugar lactone lactonase YvrE
MSRPEVVPGAPRAWLGEAPYWDAARERLWWVDIAGRQVHWRNARNGEVGGWETPAPVSAAVPSARGDVVLALADGLHRAEPARGTSAPYIRVDPRPGNRSNECRCDPQGRLWLGTMQNNLGPAGEPRPVTQASGGLFMVSAQGRVAPRLGRIGVANTLAWSPDGRWLYFADSRRRVIWRFPFHAPSGRLGAREVFVAGGPGVPDGSAVDELGALWTARWGGGCLIRYRPDGRIDQRVELPAQRPSSCAFGERDRRTLYVTTAWHGLAQPGRADGRLFAVRLPVAGLPLTPFAG